jgi:adenylate cyclase
MADVFVSYARSDKLLVAPLVSAIEARGWSVWWDPDIDAGQEFDQLIAIELAKARAVVVMWTPTSVNSRWVRGEAREAADRGLLVPVRLDGARLPLDVRAIHTTDLDGWGEDPDSPPCQELFRALDAMIHRQRGSAPAAGGAAIARDAAGRAAQHSICVLPFANMSGEPEQEYFSDGISEDIITDLSKVSALAVIARNTAFTFKGKHVDVMQLARQLKVSHVLEGSVRKAGQRVRISAQLIDGATGSHVWAERYDRDLNDIFSLQDEISQAIVAAMRLKLLPGEKAAIEQRGTSNAEAYKFFLMARQHYLNGNNDMRRLDAVIRLGQRAVEIDPGYARAWALIATAQRLTTHFGKQGSNGLDAADRALALDANLAEAHAARAGALLSNGDSDAAEREIEIALELDPESWDVNREAARLCYSRRRFELAVRYFEKAAACMDSDWSSCNMLISCYAVLGDGEASHEAAQRTLARAERLVTAEPYNAEVMAGVVGALAKLGSTDRAREWAERAVLLDPENLNMRYNIACALLMDLADQEAALRMLEPYLARVGAEALRWVKSDPDLDSLRGDPRFAEMISRAEARLAAQGSGPPSAQ